MKDANQRMETQLAIIKDLGYNLNQKSVVLDLGCGNGDLVNEYLKSGYDAYGCDFKFKPGQHVNYLYRDGKIRTIDFNVYKLPFEDNSVDVVITDQVFEHVQDYSTTLSEIKRVLKPGGVSLNFFPSRYKIIETHVNVPFGSINKKYYWLLFWAFLGVRKSTQKGLTARETAKRNYEYLNNRTYYLTKSDIRRNCEMYFSCVRFSEDVFFKHMRRASYLSKFSSVIFFLPRLYSAFRHRVLFLIK